MHVEKQSGEWYVTDHNGKRLSGGFAFKDSAIAEMRKLAREKNSRFLI